MKSECLLNELKGLSKYLFATIAIIVLIPIKFIDVALSLQKGILFVNILAKLFTSFSSNATPVVFGKCQALIPNFLGVSTSGAKLSPICSNCLEFIFKSFNTCLYKLPFDLVNFTSDDKYNFSLSV